MYTFSFNVDNAPNNWPIPPPELGGLGGIVNLYR